MTNAVNIISEIPSTSDTFGPIIAVIFLIIAFCAGFLYFYMRAQDKKEEDSVDDVSDTFEKINAKSPEEEIKGNRIKIFLLLIAVVALLFSIVCFLSTRSITYFLFGDIIPNINIFY